MQRFSLLGASPNSTAAALGATLVTFLLFKKNWQYRWGKAGAGALILSLCLTQSRSSAVGMMLAGSTLMLLAALRSDKHARLAACLMLCTAFLIGAASGINGRLSTTSLNSGAEIRSELLKPSFMYLAERRIHGISDTSEFSEYAFFRYGSKVTPYQREIIKHPLSSIIRITCEGPILQSLFLWGLWTTPIFGSVCSFFSFEPAHWLGVRSIPLIQFYCTCCAFFNDITQDTVGTATITACCLLGALWGTILFFRRLYRPVLVGAACSLLAYCSMVLAGFFWLQQANRSTGINQCNILYVNQSGLQAKIIESNRTNEGTIVVMDGGVDPRITWMCMVSASRMLRYNWRIIQLPNSDWNQWGSILENQSKTISIFCSGGTPHGWLAQFPSTLIVSVEPSRVELLSGDTSQTGVSRWWIFTNKKNMLQYSQLPAIDHSSASRFVYCPLNSEDTWIREFEKIITQKLPNTDK